MTPPPGHTPPAGAYPALKRLVDLLGRKRLALMLRMAGLAADLRGVRARLEPLLDPAWQPARC